MTSPSGFNPNEYKNAQKQQWNAVAAGWKKWWPVFERLAGHVSHRLIEQCSISNYGCRST